MFRRTRVLALSTIALVAAVALTGCMNQGMLRDDDESSAPSTASFNDPDVAFTMEMIPHHQGAVEMADVLLAKDGIDERVRELATQIKAAQSPEIELMQSWLDGWGMGGDMGGMNHGGMMSEDDMAALESATGADASRLFLEQMIVHHQGAIDMANTELADGENADVKALCTAIIASQTAEIATMKQLLTQI
jgi:uncharacterized protein (DUF305 family)